jgi:hypothetical protein
MKTPSLSELAAALLDTTASQPKPKKPAAPAKRDRSAAANEANRNHRRIEQMKVYVQRSGWRMYWGGKTKGWQFKKGSIIKSRSSTEISKLSGDTLLAFLNRK